MRRYTIKEERIKVDLQQQQDRTMYKTFLHLSVRQGWMVGWCETANRFYCWSCLLFSNKHEGLLGFKWRVKCAAKHSKSQTHAHCYVQWTLFGKQPRVGHTERRNDGAWHNEQVRKKKYYVGFPHAQCSLADQWFSSRGRNGSSTSSNKENFAEFLNVLKNHGPIVANRSNSATDI